MIPILYAATETVFTHNGIGLLADCVSCEATEERNGIFEAVIRYPVTGLHYDSISEDSIVKILTNETSNTQLFRVYKTSRPIDGIVTISLEHISYILNGNPVTSFGVANVGAAAAIESALTNATFPHGFSAWSDITTLNSASINVPTSVRAVLGGTRGGILDTWGGEYEFDNFVVKLHAARGSETDVVIEYGKNLTDIRQDKNIVNVYTALFPYAKYVTKSTVNGVEVETEHLVTLTEKTLAAPTAANYAHSKALIRDFSEDFDRDSVITESALRGVANAYMASNPIDTPDINISVSFVQLWQTAEYASIAPLERVKLCDTVTVKFPALGVSAVTKVVKTVYDCLLERYITIELGNLKSNFGQTVNNQQAQINNLHNTISVKTGSLYQAILSATAAITGQTGGYVVLNPPENPQEILVMDTPDINTATKVWRWNSGGLGYSSTGYDGEYGTAITMNGEIVADFITAGTINGALIGAGSIVADAIAAGAITADKIVVGAGDKNYVTKWDLQNWVDSTAPTPSQMLTLTDSPIGGVTQARRTYAQETNGHTIYQPASEQFEIAKGETYAFEGYYKASVAGLTFTASFSERNVSDGTSSNNFLHSSLITTVTGGWKKFSVKLSVPSSWTELMCRAYLFVRIRTGAPTSGTIDFTGITVKKTQSAAIITDGRIESVNKNTYLDLGTGELAVEGGVNKAVMFDTGIEEDSVVFDIQGLFWTPKETDVRNWTNDETSTWDADTWARIYTFVVTLLGVTTKSLLIENTAGDVGIYGKTGIRLYSANGDVELDTGPGKNILLNSPAILPNNTSIRGKTTTGTVETMLGKSTANNTVIGASTQSGHTNIYTHSGGRR